jgi:NitT/TauT family transport system substrate-binding protein
VVDGTYAKYGLDVTIRPGDPQSNGGYLLIVGKLDFYMGGDILGDFLAAQQNIPSIAVAAEWRCHIKRFYYPLLTREVKPDSIISMA